LSLQFPPKPFEPQAKPVVSPMPDRLTLRS
jgi:hypothetical protein